MNDKNTTENIQVHKVRRPCPLIKNQPAQMMKEKKKKMMAKVFTSLIGPKSQFLQLYKYPYYSTTLNIAKPSPSSSLRNFSVVRC